jgi:hypothetical protein
MAQDMDKNTRNASRRIGQIKARITGMDLVCSGTLMERKKKCGRPNCRCASDPDAVHGPYYEWNRWKGGRLVHRVVSREQAGMLAGAIANQREIKDLLRQWERETEAIVLGDRKRKS